MIFCCTAGCLGKHAAPAAACRLVVAAAALHGPLVVWQELGVRAQDEPAGDALGQPGRGLLSVDGGPLKAESSDGLGVVPPLGDRPQDGGDQGGLPGPAIGLLRLCSGQRRQCAQHQRRRLARPPRRPLGRRPGGALLRGSFRLRSRCGDDLHPLRCLLLDLLTAGSKKPKRLSWWLLRCGSGCGLCAEAGARGAPPGGRGASIIFLGRGDPFQPEIVV
jgi:hypothetical protein